MFERFREVSVELEPGVAFPRLRLPQKLSGRRATSPLPVTEEKHAIADIPTRPVVQSHWLHAASTLQPARVGVGWHPGIARYQSPNEDAVVTLQGMCTYQNRLVPFSLCVVADGMGGYEGGLEAAHLATRGMMHTVLQTIMMGNELSDEYLVDVLIGGVEWGNMAIYQRVRKRGKDMGTTLTAALIIDEKLYVVNVGDSRTYLYRDEIGLSQITHDHSLVATLVTMGQIKPEEIYTHPERNKIYRSLGHDEKIKVDWFVVELCPHDRLLLCSDGLWEMVRDPAIEQILCSSDDPVLVSERLVQTALRGGGVDNISAVVLFV